LLGATLLVGAALAIGPWSTGELLASWERLVTSGAGLAFVLIMVLALVILLRRRIADADAASLRLNRIIESTLDGIVITDRHELIQTVNAQTERIFGYSRGELIGQRIDALLPRDAHGAPQAEQAPCGSRRDPRREAQVVDLVGRHKDGRLIPVEVSINPQTTDAGTLITRVIRDATERKKTEESLREQEARLRLLIEQMPAILWTTDTKLQITSTLGRGLAELKLRPNEVIGMSLLEHLKKDTMDATPIAAHLQALRGEGLSYEMEWMDRHFQVRVEPLRNPARIITGTIGIVVDVTARKKAEQALLHKQAELMEFFQTAAIGLHWFSPEGRIRWANHSVLQLLGYTEADYVGLHLKDIHADAAGVDDMLDRLRTAEALRNHETTLRCKDGAVRHVLIDAYPLRENGKLVHTRCFLRDITEHKRLEGQLRHSQKMEAVGRLAGGIAHDFNNLLTIVNGYSDLLLQQLPEGTLGRESMLEIRKAGERAARLTSQLLTFSRHQVMSPSVLDLNVLVHDIQELFKRLLGEDIELITDLDPALRTIKADSGQMEQVLMNLAVNSRDAMPHGGKLLIRTSNVELDKTFTRLRPEVKPGQYVRLSVTDTGHGMDEATVARIFEPFFTTKETGKGTGLGLATVYGIIKQSEGYIYVQSAVGTGTTFDIYLPGVQSRPSGRGLGASQSTRSTGSETILVVEDEEALRRLAAQVLEHSGYKVLVAGHGAEAEQICRSHPGRIDLLATDIIMPRMGGRELAAAARRTRPDLKVLFLSGYTDDNTWSTEAELLQKPFTPDTLTHKVRNLLDAR
jgi:PAS domain S-box-containing protein